MNRFVIAVVAFLLVLLVLSSSLFVVDQSRIGVVKTFGEVHEVVTEPGLNFNWPVVQTVTLLDRRVQTLNDPDPHPAFTSDKNSVVVDWLVRWRIGDARQFIRGNSGMDQHVLEGRLATATQSAFAEETARHTLRGVLSDDRGAIVQAVQTRLAGDAKSMGVEIVDVRIKRADFTAALTDSVYKRMNAERAKVATELRAAGKAEQQRIQSDADRQRAEILAQAQVDAQKTKGDADAQASALYADAFGRDPKFAAFYRSLQAYRASFHDKSDVIVVDPNNAFFDAMRGAGVGGGAGLDAPAAPRRH